MRGKKPAALLLAVLLLIGTAACGGTGHSGGLHVVVTVFPVYDWVRVILGEDSGAELTWLMDGGADMHSYQPSEEDLAAIADCDVFIYIGGASDAWAEEAAAQAGGRHMIAVDLMEALGTAVRLEEITAGMEAEGEEPEYDEHIWLSLPNARILTAYLAAVLAEADPKHAEAYTANAEAYNSDLMLLDASYMGAVRSAEIKTLLFADRYPFRYLADDYGLTAYAAFPGCSAETEAGFETILFLADKCDELGLPAILTLEGSDGRIARTVAENTQSSPEVLTIDSMQSVTAAQAEAGVTYLSVMEDDLTVLRQALGSSAG